MEQIKIDDLPEAFKNRSISEKQAVNSLAEFVCLNYPIFGLHHYSEDFRSEILVKILEKGSVIIRSYDSKRGNFFAYFYCYVTTMIKSEIKSLSRKSINEQVFQNHCAENYDENQLSYSRITSRDFDTPKIPYNFKPISSKNLRAAFHALPDRNAKRDIIIALKYAYYVNDRMIDALCRTYKLNRNDFIDNLQCCKNSVLAKSERNYKIVQSRNKNYFYHKRYEYQLDKMTRNKDFDEIPHVKLFLETKDKNQLIRLKNQNRKLDDKKNELRTSNKLIADLLDLCERQVSYYIKQALKELEEEQEKEEKKEVNGDNKTEKSENED